MDSHERKWGWDSDSAGQSESVRAGVTASVPMLFVLSVLALVLAGSSGCQSFNYYMSPDGAEKVFFRSGSAAVSRADYKKLVGIANNLENRTGYKLVLKGYTDPKGDYDANLQLSRDRVTEVRRILEEMGVSPDTIAGEGFGEAQAVRVGKEERLVVIYIWLEDSQKKPQ